MAYEWRNVDADELIWIVNGEGRCWTEYGSLTYAPGDFLGLPRGITWRLLPSDPHGLSLHIESRSPVEYCRASDPVDAIEVPEPEEPGHPAPSDGEIEIRVRRAGQLTSFFYAESVPPVVGWRGDLFPFRLAASHARGSHPLFRGRGWVLSDLPARAAERRGVSGIQRDVDRDVIVCRENDAGMLWAPAGAPRPVGAPPAASAVAIEAFAPLVITPDVRSVMQPLA